MQKLRKAWTKKSFRSLKYDILLDSRDDVVSKCGFYRLLDAALSIHVCELLKTGEDL